MYYLLAAVGTIVAYELVARLAESYRRRTDLHKDARLNRARILNQRGQVPGEVE